MQWDSSINASDIGGILKRKLPKEEQISNHKELFIFGYEAKIFRDDSRAIEIDKGLHLIEWNGVKIDRYDVRATLLDSIQLQTPPGGYGNRLDCLPIEEQRAEQLAEEERYYVLKHDEGEELMYQEEELKRLLLGKESTYGQVEFNYNSKSESGKSSVDYINENPKLVEPENPFVPLKNFSIPNSINLPNTMNQHVIIEKTARFISNQGPQMEILIKAKQSNNSKFEFLNLSNNLNPYYKFVLNSIKNGTYPQQEIFEIQNFKSNEILASKSNNINAFNSYNLNRLSLDKKIVKKPVYKPSPNCAYTQLISKIKGVPLPDILSEINSSPKLPVETVKKENLKETNGYSENFASLNNVEIKNMSSGLMLAQTYSDSEDEINSNDKKNENCKANFPFVIPPENIKTVIDKTAIYVLKNGKQFEETLRMKGDERFMFLNEASEFYNYYLYKIDSLNPQIFCQSKRKRITPVSFSIKPKEDVCVNKKSTISQKHDKVFQITQDATETIVDKEYSQPSNDTSFSKNDSKVIETVENNLAAKSFKITSTQPFLFKKPVNDKTNQQTSQNLEKKSISEGISSSKTTNEKHKKLKLAEEKIKDRLAQIAREKLGLISKERQLQLERKKKAIVFLSHIKGGVTFSNSIKSAEENKTDNNFEHYINNTKMFSSINEEIMADQLHCCYLSKFQLSNKTFQEQDANSSFSLDIANSSSCEETLKNFPYFNREQSRKLRSRTKIKKKKRDRHHTKKKAKKSSRSTTPCQFQILVKSSKNSRISKKSKKHKNTKDS